MPPAGVPLIGGKELGVFENSTQLPHHLLLDDLLRCEPILIDESSRQSLKHRLHVGGHSAAFDGEAEHSLTRAGDGGEETVLLFTERWEISALPRPHQDHSPLGGFPPTLSFQFVPGLAVESLFDGRKHPEHATDCLGLLKDEIKMPRRNIQRHHANGHKLFRLREGTEADSGKIVGAFHGKRNDERRMTNGRTIADEKIQRVLGSFVIRGFPSFEFATSG